MLGIRDSTLTQAVVADLSRELSSPRGALHALRPWLATQHGEDRVALYSPTWNAMLALLSQGFSISDALKWETFGLFDVDADVTPELLAAAWHMDASEDGRARCALLLLRLPGAAHHMRLPACF